MVPSSNATLAGFREEPQPKSNFVRFALKAEYGGNDSNDFPENQLTNLGHFKQ